MALKSVVYVLVFFCGLNLVQAFAPRNELINPHIVGGEEINIEAISYQAVIKKWLGFLCGGTIISKYHVLSAAHCFDHRSWTIAYGVGVGSSNRHYGTYKFVRKIVTHEKYKEDTSDYDIAVITTLFPMEQNGRVRRISIVDQGNRVSIGTRVAVSGWGRTSQDNETFPTQLMRTYVSILPQNECAVLFQKPTERNLCTGAEEGGRGSCYGDSGGPLVNPLTGELIGIISHGTLLCGNPKFPALYTDLSHHEIRRFINENTK